MSRISTTLPNLSITKFTYHTHVFQYIGVWSIYVLILEHAVRLPLPVPTYIRPEPVHG